MIPWGSASAKNRGDAAGPQVGVAQADRAPDPRHWSTMSRPPTQQERDAEVSVYVSGRQDRRLGDPEAMGPGCAAAARSRSSCSPWSCRAAPSSPPAAGCSAGSRSACWLVVWALALAFGLLFLVNRGWFLGLLGRAWFADPACSGRSWASPASGRLLFVDAWRLGQPGRLVIQARRWLTGLTAALLVVTSGGLRRTPRPTWPPAGTPSTRSSAATGPWSPSTAATTSCCSGADSGTSRVGTAARQHPARQRRRRDRPGGDLRLLPRDREHRLPRRGR